MNDLLFLPDLTAIEPPQENETDMMFKVEAIYPPERCPECGFDKLYKHSSRKQLIMDLPIRLKRVGLQLNRRRYKCRECDSTFWERLISIDEKRSMTRRLLESIEEQSMSKTFVEVAESVGVDEKTVRNVFKDYAAFKEREYQFETPKWLGIDEIHIIRKPRLVLTNVERRTIYDIKKDRNKDTVIKRLLEIEDRSYIEYVTMDMWKPYKDAVNIVLPHAKVVVDKFHVVRMANQALDSVRKSLRTNMTPKGRRTLMRDRFILLKRRHDLIDRELLLLETWLGNIPDLKEAYELKEEFYKIWDTPSSQEGEKRYINWRQRCVSSNVKDAYKDLVRAVDNWNEEIFNHFDKRLTNAYTESINSIIRHVERLGKGYSFDSLRAKILFNEKLHKKRKPRFNKNAFYDALPNMFDHVTDHNVSDNFGIDFTTFIKELEKGEL
ncbi:MULTISPECIES: ISL3 family transposase [Bacillaceae]|uniref:ISL3 family transposase n=2 Tax=Gracilibacillus TaxID=74385 RepID=A0A6N7R5X2_9BACI|nr:MULTISPECIES: ISL3 family transposase [Bacillaceae]MRI68637.1 ISL3 family transposase [Gracilibacillus thailandensis]